MNAAADIIDALNARAGAPSRLREAARESWAGWMGRLANRPGRVTGAPAQALVDQLAARPLAPPPRRSGTLTHWQSFATLWRQQWHPASSDERGWRWTASGASAIWHVIIILLLVWITALHFMHAEDEDAGEAIQVEFIGVGTPEDEGGGEPPAPGESVATPASSAASSGGAPAVPSPATPSISMPSAPAPEIIAPIPDVAARVIPEPAQAPQPLAVSTPVTPEPPVFELPPPTPPTPSVDLPALTRVPPVRVVDIPEPVRAPPVAVATPQIAVEPVPAPVPSVVAREVPTPVRLPTMRAPPAVPAPAASVAAEAPRVVARDLPAPRAAPTSSPNASAATSPSAAAANAASSASTPTTRAGESASASGPDVATRNPGIGTGPRSAPAPGSWATPRRADDWGQSKRNVPGRGDGIFDGDGRPRIGAAPGSASPGRPPGTVTQEIADLDRAGTWLRRKAYPYEPTRFDRFWRPSETLLQEWVRRGIKQVSIPIPGSSKRIVCGISILQLGGGCWPVDPNLNEQPATARPPPDIPFKPHLQEGDGVTIPPPPGSPPGAEAASPADI